MPTSLGEKKAEKRKMTATTDGSRKGFLKCYVEVGTLTRTSSRRRQRPFRPLHEPKM